MSLRRKTREAYARDRQQVRFEVCQPTVAQQRADIAANKRKAELLRRSAEREKVCECIGNRRPNPECYWHGER